MNNPNVAQGMFPAQNQANPYNVLQQNYQQQLQQRLYQQQNQYQQNQYPQSQYQPQTQIIRVHGIQGVYDTPMGPNSSQIFLDDSGQMVWVATTDNIGSKNSVVPYDISPHVEPAVPDFSAIESRLKKLEDMMNGNTGNSSATSAE